MENVSELSDSLNISQWMNITIRILRVLVLIIWLNHVLGCTWYGIGRGDGVGGERVGGERVVSLEGSLVSLGGVTFCQILN